MRSEGEFLALLEAKLATPRRSSGRRVALVGVTAAVIVALASVGVAMARHPGGEIDRPETGHAVTEIGGPIEEPPVPWSQHYGGAAYSLNSREPLPIEAGDIAADLGGGLWALDGVTTDYFVLYREDGQYWGYVNYAYRPASLGALVEELSLERYLEFGPLYVSHASDGKSYRVEALHPKVVREILFAAADAVPQRLTVQVDPTAIETQPGELVTPPYDPSGQYLYDRTIVADWSVAISLPKLGFHNISIMAASEADGDWLWTNLLAHGNYFASPGVVVSMLAHAGTSGGWVDITPDPNETGVGVPE